MARAASTGREFTITQAAEAWGLTHKAVSDLANKCPAELVKARGARRMLMMPEFAVWYREWLQRDRKQAPKIEDARARHENANAELMELRLDQAKGDLVPVTEFDEVLSQTLARLRSTLLNVPNRFAQRTVGLDTLKQSQVVWDGAIREVLKVLMDEPDEEVA
jgi:hypothetical protein